MSFVALFLTTYLKEALSEVGINAERVSVKSLGNFWEIFLDGKEEEL